jgi:hypothetical protein
VEETWPGRCADQVVWELAGTSRHLPGLDMVFLPVGAVGPLQLLSAQGWCLLVAIMSESSWRVSFCRVFCWLHAR